MLEYLAEFFLNPQKRLFLGYLISAGVIALLYLTLFKQTSLWSIFRGVLSLNTWVNPSTLGDYKMLVINQIFIRNISAFLLATQLALSTLIVEFLSGISVIHTTLPSWVIIAFFTLTLFIFDDFSRYFVHRLMHKTFLWKFHKVHHSATTLTPFTVLRTHPVEALLFSFRSLIVHGVSIGVFYYLFGSSVELYQIYGASIFVFLFHTFGSNLRHSHVDLGYFPWLEKILISPKQHQIHHSILKEHFDTNFGAVLSIWDRISGSIVYSKHTGSITFGLKNNDESAHTLKNLLFPK